LKKVLWWQERLAQWNGKALVQQKETIVIKSDASLQGWGAVCSGTRTGGPWSKEEQEMHINCLELLAATLAVQSFLKDQEGVSILLQLNNQTAAAYINNLGGTVSPRLTNLAKDLWMWARTLFLLQVFGGTIYFKVDFENLGSHMISY